MFVSVWLGGTRYQLLNLNCMLVNIMDLLRQKCAMEDDDVLIDLAGEDGMICGLPEYHPRMNARHLLKPRATYVPVKIERDDDNAVKPYEPLVADLKDNKEFMGTLLAQYRKKERPSPGKKEKTTGGGRNRGSTSSTSGARQSPSGTRLRSKKGGNTSRAGKSSR